MMWQFVANVQRKTWDIQEYERKAKEKDEQKQLEEHEACELDFSFAFVVTHFAQCEGRTF